MTNTPNKPAALEAVASLFVSKHGDRQLVFHDDPFVHFLRGEGWAETPLTNKAQATNDVLRLIDPDDLLSLIDDAISKSLDMDWEPIWGARNVVRVLEHQGWIVVPANALTDLSKAQERIDRLEERVADAYRALRSIAEGNLGDAAKQSNYETIRQVARNAIKGGEQ